MTGFLTAPGRPASLLPGHDVSARGAAGLEAAQSRLDEQSERLLWTTYCRAIALQWAEPGPTTNIIRRAVFKVWEQAFLVDEAVP